MLAGQNEVSVADRVEMVEGSDVPSRLSGFLEIQKIEFEGASCCFCESADSNVDFSLSSFLHMSHSPEDLPQTLMVSIAVSSIVPKKVIK